MRFFVRVVIVSGDEGSRTLYAFDLSEEDLRGSVIEPFQRGSRVVLGETSVGAADIREITISEVRRHVRGVPLGFLRRSWLAGHTERSGDWIAQHAATVTDRFLGDPASSSEMQPEAQKMSEPDRAEPPKAIAAALVVVGLCSIIATLLAAPGWVGGATIAAVISVLVLHRKIWRWPPVVVPSVAAVVAVAIGGLLGAIIAPDRTSTQPQGFNAAAAASSAIIGSGSLVSPFQLKTSFLAYDTAWGKTWRSRLTADSTDPLKLELRLQNIASTATPDLEVGLLSNSSGGGSTLTEVIHQIGDYGYPYVGPEVQITQYSAGFGPLTLGLAMLLSAPGRPLRALTSPRSNTMTLPLGETLAGDYLIGSLAPRSEISLKIPATYATPTDSQLGGGNTIVYQIRGMHKWLSAGAVRPGTHVEFSILLNNDGFQPVGVRARVQVRRHLSGEFLTVTALAWESGAVPFNDPGPISQGTAILNADGRRLNTVSVIPGTTQLWQGTDKPCTRQKVLAHLANGIARHQIVVGEVGGFRPHDPCHGGDFTRFVNFKAVVR
jgi:hypothetical protein